MSERRALWIATIWQAGAVLTAIYLTFFDGYPYNAWNWLVAVPVNLFLSVIWPIYWVILRPIMET